MPVHQLDRAEARRIAVRAQLLDSPRPSDLLAVVHRLTLVQIDPTAAVAPSADLVLWSRLGPAYRPSQLQEALERDRTLFEHSAMVRPMSDLPLYLAGASQRPSRTSVQEWLRVNDPFRRDILDRLGADGPLLSRDLPDTCVQPWPSTGWTDNRNGTPLLEVVMGRGEGAIAGRVGRQRLWDLPSRVYPAGLPTVSVEESAQRRNERRLGALGIARAKGPVTPVEPADVGDAGEPAVVEGVPGEWRVDPAQLGRPFRGRTALLSPFDRLVHDRDRIRDLFGFDYGLEMYKPKARRRWGYFALPVLHGDRLVGKVDATADRKAGVLVVHAIHEDVQFSARIAAAVQKELDDLAAWLGLVRS